MRGHKVEEHVGRFGLMKKGHSLPEPKKKPKRHKRLTPLRERAERAGVLHRFKVTPPGLRERALRADLFLPRSNSRLFISTTTKL